MNERVNPFKKLQKPGKHVKRIVIGAAGLVIYCRACRRCYLSDPGAGTGSIDNFRSAEGSGRNRTAF